MEDNNYDTKEWPPKPLCAVDVNEKSNEYRKEVKLLGEKVWIDTLLGALAGFISLTLLTFLFFNSWAASVLPSQQRFPSGVRLFLGWFLASTVHYAMWRLLLAWNYVNLSQGLLWTGIPTSIAWLLIISIACVMEYAR